MGKGLKAFAPAAAMLCMLLAQGCGSGGSTPPVIDQVKEVKVQQAGDNNASGAKVTYTIAYSGSGDYTYNISNFESGDKLVFPAGNPISVDNASFTDGKLTLSCTSTAGARVTVQLMNLSAQQDKVVSVSDLNTLFGAGTVTQL